jgi:hypothetical protein
LLFLPWERLAHIYMLCMELSPTAIYLILQRCPTLISCGLCVGLDAVVPPATTITLQHLTRITVIASSVFNWDDFIRPLTTPSLLSLTIYGPAIPIQPFQSLIIRSGCSLEEATFDTILPAIDDPGLESLVDNLGAVMMLHIDSWIIPASVVRQIHKGVLPLLRKGTFTVHPDGFDALLDFIDEYIPTSPNHTKAFLSLTVKCTGGPGNRWTERRYLARQEVYNSYDSQVHLIARFPGRL